LSQVTHISATPTLDRPHGADGANRPRSRPSGVGAPGTGRVIGPRGGLAPRKGGHQIAGCGKEPHLDGGARPGDHLAVDTDDITLTQIDVERLTRLIQENQTGHAGEVARRLGDKIARAPVIPASQVPPDLVTMNSLVVCEDEATGKQSELVLAYPRNADAWRGRVSILSPQCAALLGMKVGQSSSYALPDGGTARFRVVAIKYQPEKEGDLHL